MSYWIDEKEQITPKDLTECKWLYNEICCNEKAYMCREFPSGKECKECPFFELEVNVQ